MAQYAEEEFGRLLSESPSQDIDMNDAVHHDEEVSSLRQQDPKSAAQHFENTAMDQDSPFPPIHSTEHQTQWPDVAKFIIAVDFGTTFSSVAFARVEGNASARLLGSESVRCIDHYPDMPPGGSATVLNCDPTAPTELLCQTQNTKGLSKDLPSSDSWDRTSTCSLDEEWASPPPEDSDREQNAAVTETRNVAITNSVWGWGVHSMFVRPENIPEGLKHLKNFKLQLDESDAARALRRESSEEMRALKGVKVVDIIADYLGHLLKHAKARLTEFHDLHDDSLVEFVLCVPTFWTDKACRIMQNALTTAIETSQFAKLNRSAMKDLFIVAESEAAAAYVLDDPGCASEMTAFESFLVLDCGGGTVDAVTYTLTQSSPARFDEVVKPDGISCGSSFLNNNFKTCLQERLKHATIIGNDSSLDSIIAAKVQEFENDKRSVNILDKKAGFNAVYIHGLQADDKHGFRKNKLDLTWKEMYEIFKPCICGVADLMRKQLDAAKKRRVNVQTVILIGGFGGSPSLKNHLKKVLRKERNLLNQSIDLVPSNYVESAVARGAVLRALRKEHGPQRITRSSYGVLRDLRYDKDNPLHRRFRVSRDPADGELYVKKTIYWVINKGTLVPTKHEIPVKSRHIFPLHETDFLCEEVLYVSSDMHPSGYKVNHQMNKGAEEAGRIVAPLAFLRTCSGFDPITEQNAGGKSYSYYEIEYDLWLIIEGRNLRFEARSPLNPDEVKASSQFCIAAGFVPGTE